MSQDNGHTVKETSLSLDADTDAVLAVPTRASEVRLFEPDNGTMSQARLAKGPAGDDDARLHELR